MKFLLFATLLPCAVLDISVLLGGERLTAAASSSSEDPMAPSSSSSCRQQERTAPAAAAEDGEPSGTGGADLDDDDNQRQQCEKEDSASARSSFGEYAICPPTEDAHRSQIDAKLDSFHFDDSADMKANLDRFVAHVYEDPWGSGGDGPPVHGYVHANRVRTWGRMLANLLIEKNGVQWQRGDLEIVDVLTALHDAGRQGCEGHDVYERHSARAISRFLGHYRAELLLGGAEIEDLSKSVINMVEPRHVPQTGRGKRLYRLENAADCLDIMRIYELDWGFDATRLASVLSGADRFGGGDSGGDNNAQYSLDWNGDEELRRLLEEVDAFIAATDPLRNHGARPPVADDPILLRQAMDDHLRENVDKYPLIARYYYHNSGASDDA